MRTTFTVLESYNTSFVGVLSMRLRTAMEMFDFQSKTHSHSEYQGCWDIFLDELGDLLKDKSVNVDFSFEHYKGVSDMIVEVKVFIRQKDNETEIHDIYSEQISGTVLQELFNHFELRGWKTPTLEGRMNKDELEKLIVFKTNY